VVLAFYAYPTAFAASLLQERLGFAVVATPHGSDLYPNFHGLKKPRVANVIRRGYRGADRIVSISGYISQRLRDFVGEPLPPIDVVHNGIDLAAHDADVAEARRHPPELTVEQPYLLHLGRVAPLKRFDLGVEAVHRLRDEFERRGLQYAHVGDGAALNDVRARVERYDPGSIVQVLGRRVGAQKAWLYAFDLIVSVDVIDHVVIATPERDVRRGPALIPGFRVGWSPKFMPERLRFMRKRVPFRHAQLAVCRRAANA